MTEPSPSMPTGVPAGVARLTGPLRDILEEGIAHQRAHRFREAEAAYRRALAQHPDQPDTLNLLATLIIAAGGVREAAGLLRRAVQQRPDDVTLRSNLAGVLMLLDWPDAAFVEIEAARVIDPESADVAMNRAHVLRGLGRAAESLEIYKKLLAANPANVPARIGLGRCCAELGRTAEATAAFRDVIQRRPNDPIAYAELVDAARASEDAGDLARIVTLARRREMPPPGRIDLFHAAAAICDDLGRYDEAFAHAGAAKALARAADNTQPLTESVDRLIDTFTTELFVSKHTQGNPSPRQVFVVGMPRSGTALVGRALAAHPRAFDAGEHVRIRRLTTEMVDLMGAGRAYPEGIGDLTPEGAAGLAAVQLDRLVRLNAEAERIVDRLPTNFEHLGFIAVLFPQARIIHCGRDPLDTCLSCYLHRFPDEAGEMHSLGQIAHYYQEYERLMAHWRGVLPLPILDVSYEDLATAPERVMRQMVDFIGLPWDDRCLGGLAAGGPLVAAIARDPVGRWRHYEKHLTPLRGALGP